MRLRLPASGRDAADILEKLASLKADDLDWHRGRVGLYVYHDTDDLLDLLKNAYGEYFSENALGTRAFPSVARMERDIVAMALDLFAAPLGASGVFTTGGTESIFLALKTARDRAVSECGGAPAGGFAVVAPRTAHPAFDKVAHFLGLVVRRVPVDQNFRADVRAMERMIGPDTIMLVGSAPSFTHGVFDPIDKLSALAVERGLWLHVDACVGGFLAPFAREAGYPVPEFDFELAGVSSISADLHKYGMAPKGASFLVLRSQELEQHLGFFFDSWPRGNYATRTVLGSRPAGSVAAAWAVMHHLGRDGYVKLASKVMETKARLVSGIAGIRGLHVVEPSELSVVLLASDDHRIDIYAVAELMAEKGWYLGHSDAPKAIHFMLNPVHAQAVDDFLDDLARAVEVVLEKELVGVFNGDIY